MEKLTEHERKLAKDVLDEIEKNAMGSVRERLEKELGSKGADDFIKTIDDLASQGLGEEEIIKQIKQLPGYEPMIVVTGTVGVTVVSGIKGCGSK